VCVEDYLHARLKEILEARLRMDIQSAGICIRQRNRLSKEHKSADECSAVYANVDLM
jgi:hypothetical protein